MDRVVIIGGPKTGKTTVANKLGARHKIPVKHCDSLIGLRDWSGASSEIAQWFAAPGPWIIEGVAAVRGLRKWLEDNPAGKPADVLLVMQKAKLPRTDKQESMAKGADTIWREIAAEVRARGTKVQVEQALGG